MDGAVPKKKISLLKINKLMVALSVALALFTIAEGVVNTVRYREMGASSALYSSFIKAAEDMNDASDYLTYEARKFVNFKDRRYLDNYFEELTVTRRREKAAELLEGHLGNGKISKNLKAALDYSDQLAQIEFYAMRLVAEAMKYNIEDFPEQIVNVELKTGHKQIEGYSQLALAGNMVTGEEYESLKSKIRENVSRCVESIYDEAMVFQTELSGKMLGSSMLQELLIIILLAVICATAALNVILLFRPLKRSEDSIKRDEKIPMTGSREMQFFALAYNRIFEKNARKRKQLSYEVTHDALTGVFNRTALDKDIEEENWDSVALLIADIDGFKKINDTYLHSTGDRVLKLVAESLRATFRADDRVYRIGGDEFAIVMIGAGPEHEELIRQKYDSLCARVEENKEEYYGATLSFGVAYGNWETDSASIFKRADTLLYKVKKDGKNGIAFEKKNAGDER